jgi:hypothetical protein
MLRDYVDRGMLGASCWLVGRLRARGPLPTRLLVAAGLVRLVDGEPYAETTAGTWTRLPGVADAPPPRPDTWRRSSYWTRDPEPPARPASWHRVP